MSDQEEDYVGPDDWRRHKPYGAGISRKRINFVKAGSAPASATSNAPPTTTTSTDVSSFYLDLVFKRGGRAGTIPSTPKPVPERFTHTATSEATETPALTTDTTATETTATEKQKEKQVDKTTDLQICDICSLPVHDPTTHAHTLAHQSSLPHSELPHHLDRSSQGLKYLVSRGWDPDKKVGLGKEGAEGERVPMAVKLKVKHDKVGLGIKVKNKDKGKIKGAGTGSGGSGSEGKVVKRKLDAKSARKEAERERDRRKALAAYLNQG